VASGWEGVALWEVIIRLGGGWFGGLMGGLQRHAGWRRQPRQKPQKQKQNLKTEPRLERFVCGTCQMGLHRRYVVIVMS